MMRLTVYKYEGTPEEILSIQRALELEPQVPEQKVGLAESEPVKKPALVEDDDDGQFVSEKVARLAFARRPLSVAQKVVLTTLYAAGDKWTLATELQKKTGYSRAEFAGLMGAFGRRIAYTRGFKDGSWLFDYQWDDVKGCYKYRLPLSVRRAAEQSGAV